MAFPFDTKEETTPLAYVIISKALQLGKVAIAKMTFRYLKVIDNGVNCYIICGSVY